MTASNMTCFRILPKMSRFTIFCIIVLVLAFLSQAVHSSSQTSSPTVPREECGLRGGLRIKECNELRNRWLNGICQEHNVDNWPDPIVWVGQGCGRWKDGGCKIYNSCQAVHCFENCRKMSFCKWVLGGGCQPANAVPGQHKM